METADVVIVGAGPAGSAAAVVLARAGRSVLLADKATFPRDKCCGDGLTTLALRELEHLGFDPGAVPNWFDVDAAWLRSPSGREVCVPLPQGRGLYAATAPRRELDAALVELARKEGVDVREGCTLTGIDDDSAGKSELSARFSAHNVQTSVTARYLIAADGMWSPTRKLLGVAEPGYLGEWHAFRQYARSVTGPARERLYVWFEPDLLPGYMWSFPLPDGRVNIGFGVQRDGVRRVQAMKALWDELLTRPHVVAALGPDAELEDRHTAWPIPAGIDRATLSTGRTLFVGDAAMATDVMTGEGIGQALLTGRLAAEAIVHAGALQPQLATAEYERSVRAELVADHRMSAALSRILSSERGARGAIRILSTSDWVRRNFARWMFEDEPRALVFTPFRWHRAFLSRPGTFRGSVTPGDAWLPFGSMRTRLTEMLDIEHPIMLAGMGGVSYHRLVAAVSEAGGIGTLGASTMAPDELPEEMAKVRELTSKPFGVDLLTALPGQIERGIQSVVEGGASIFVAGLGVPREVIEMLHSKNILIGSMCGKVRHAVSAVASGVDFVVAEGTEAGGHTGQIATMALVPQVVDAVGHQVPVVAAGGLYDGRGLAASLALGADGVWIGTRFIATPEARAVKGYKETLLATPEDGTIVSRSFTGKTCRVVRNEWTNYFEEHPEELKPFPAQVFASGQAGVNHLGAPDGTEVDVTKEFMPCGQGVGAMTELVPAAQLVGEMMAEAERTIDRLAGVRR